MTPKIVIVGRPNVGKSSLMNMLADRRVSIVDATPGVTRDRVTTLIELPAIATGDPPLQVELIDTGGHGIDDTQNLTAQVERQIALGVNEADLILFIVDAQSGILPLDQQVAKLLRTSAGNKKILLVANKVDALAQEPLIFEAMKLGFGEPTKISAVTRHNRGDFLQAIRDQFDWNAIKDAPTIDSGVLVAIVGKRNAGKSTLVNALAGQQRVIVSEIEGTTRDAIDVRFQINDQVFTAIDTAGVRKRKSLENDIEYYSYHRCLRSIRRADVVLLLIDATLPVSQVDKQLGNEMLKHHKPCVIVINKWDLVESDHTKESYLEYLDKALGGFTFAPIAFISATNNEGPRDVMAMAINLYKQSAHRVSTGKLNRILEQILAKKTPSSSVGKRPKVYYVTQLEIHPPTIGLFVNDPDLFNPEYQRFLINRFRDELPFSEVPIKLLIRSRASIPKNT